MAPLAESNCSSPPSDARESNAVSPDPKSGGLPSPSHPVRYSVVEKQERESNPPRSALQAATSPLGHPAIVLRTPREIRTPNLLDLNEAPLPVGLPGLEPPL